MGIIHGRAGMLREHCKQIRNGRSFILGDFSASIIGSRRTVAGLIRWSMEAAAKSISDAAKTGVPNARFIVLDPNGEYAKAFADQGDKLRLFKVPPVVVGERPLAVPAWLWNGHEWTAVAHAQPGAQRPLLMQGLRELKSGHMEGVPREALIRRYLVSYSTRVTALLNTGTLAFAGAPRQRFECARLLETIASDCTQFAGELVDSTSNELVGIATVANEVINSRRSGNYFNDFSVVDLESVRDALNTLAQTLPDMGTASPIGEDAPLYFNVNMLAEHLERIATEQGGNLSGFISTLGLRIRGMLADQRLGSVIGGDPQINFDAWLRDYVGDNGASNGSIAVIDLSLVPSEVVHIVVSVLGRLVFESLQRYRRSHPQGASLPTVLVLEEAHAFVRRGMDDGGQAGTPAQLCRETFERIAREGRKFGLGLVLPTPINAYLYDPDQFQGFVSAGVPFVLMSDMSQGGSAHALQNFNGSLIYGINGGTYNQQGGSGSWSWPNFTSLNGTLICNSCSPGPTLPACTLIASGSQFDFNSSGPSWPFGDNLAIQGGCVIDVSSNEWNQPTTDAAISSALAAYIAGNARTGTFSVTNNSPPSDNSVQATLVGTFSGQPSDGDYLGIPDSGYYYFRTALTGSPYEVLIGVDLPTTLANFAAAINDSGGEGTIYNVNNTPNYYVTAMSTNTTLNFTAIIGGTTGNYYSATSTGCSVCTLTNSGTFSGGVPATIDQIAALGLTVYHD